MFVLFFCIVPCFSLYIKFSSQSSVSIFSGIVLRVRKVVCVYVKDSVCGMFPRNSCCRNNRLMVA